MTKDVVTAEAIAAVVVENHFPPIRYAVCQNVSFALLPYEADIIAVTEAGTVHEIEIKLSKSDLKADAKKQRWSQPHVVDYYWLAVPKALKEDAVKRAKEIGAGVFLVYSDEYYTLCDEIKKPRRWITKDAAPLHHFRTIDKAYVKEWRRGLASRVYRLAALRYWDIVFARNRNQNEDTEEKEEA